jgi:hypothetical protein
MQARESSKRSRLVVSKSLIIHFANKQGIGIDLTLGYGYRAFLTHSKPP